MSTKQQQQRDTEIITRHGEGFWVFIGGRPVAAGISANQAAQDAHRRVDQLRDLVDGLPYGWVWGTDACPHRRSCLTKRSKGLTCECWT